MTFTHALSTNNYGPAKFIVDSNAANGSHTTIAAALTSASSGDTIFIRPGTYTENLTLKAGVLITAYAGDGVAGNVIILGKATASGAGTFSISNVQLKTNSDFCLLVSGSSATAVQLLGVFLNSSNNTGISFTTSNASATITAWNCTFNLATTGIGHYSMSSTGAILIYRSDLQNSGGSSTVSSNSAGSVSFNSVIIASPISTTSTGLISGIESTINTAAQNVTCLTTAGSGATNGWSVGTLTSGSASAASIGTGTTISLEHVQVSSSNTNAITGAGTLVYGGLTFTGTSAINVTTQSGGLLPGGTFQAPTAGFIGEQIRANATAVSLTSATPKTVTSIALTPGIWDISALADIGFSLATGNQISICISTTTNTVTGTNGDAYTDMSTTVSNWGNLSASVPAYRVTLTSNATYYLVVTGASSTGTLSCNGRISATRVG